MTITNKKKLLGLSSYPINRDIIGGKARVKSKTNTKPIAFKRPISFLLKNRL